MPGSKISTRGPMSGAGPGGVEPAPQAAVVVQLGGQASGVVTGPVVVVPAEPATAVVPEEPPPETVGAPPVAPPPPPETLALPLAPPRGALPASVEGADEQPTRIERRVSPRAVKRRGCMRFVLS